MNDEPLLDGRLKFRHLVLFRTIAEQGGVVRAAQAAGVTQPTVTRALHELESMFGAELFVRGPKGVTLTPFGEVLLEHALAILRHITRAREHIDQLQSAETGTVSVGTNLAAAHLLLPRAIARVKEASPTLAVAVRDGSPDALLRLLTQGEVEIVVGRLAAADAQADVVQKRLYEEPIRLVCRAGHPATEMRAPEIADLLAFPWVLPDAPTIQRDEMRQVFAEAGDGLPHNVVMCSSILTLRTLLLETDAIAPLPVLIALNDESLTLLPTRLDAVPRQIGLTLPAHLTPTPSARLLIDRLVDVGAEIREEVRRRVGVGRRP